MAMKSAAVVPEVVEKNRAVAVVKKAQQPTEGVVVKAIAKQIAVVQGAELRSNFEKLKLGAMVSVAVRQLKLENGASRGPTAAGGGALGWWASVCPRDRDGQPVIAYRTVMRWKEAAERLPALLASDVNPEKMMALLATNPKKAVGRDARILASAEKLTNGMTMRQMLLWGGDGQADAKRGNGGRPKGTKADLEKKPDSTDALAAARAVWSKIIVPADREAVALAAAANLLNAQDVENAKIFLRNLMDLLNEREKALKANMH